MKNKWFEQLTEAQKTKLRGMGGSLEELIAFCKEEKLDLPDDVLGGVNGGVCMGFIPTIFDETDCEERFKCEDRYW